MIVPEINPLTRPYWEGARSRRLRLQRCRSCSHTWHPPSPACCACGSVEFDWQDASGVAHVHSYIIVRESFDPTFDDRLPLVVALIRLEEGPLVISNILDCDPEQVFVEMPVELDWEPISDEIVLPQFKPRKDPPPPGR